MDKVAVSSLAKRILDYAMDSLRLSLRFMDKALHRLETREADNESFAINGAYLDYSALWILRRYKQSTSGVALAYLHAILHCVFLHMYVGPTINVELWDLACDIAVENVIFDLSLPGLVDVGAERKESRLRFLKQSVKSMTAEHIYAWLKSRDLDPEQLSQWKEIFYVDDHSPWYPDASKDSSSSAASVELEKVREEWESIAEAMLTDLETFSRQQGDEAGDLLQNLRDITRERYSYAEFLRRFATRQEAMKLDMEEFDYAFYTYGLQLYGNVALVEPLEYREEARIKELVIAIDTSGSVSGDLVNGFMRKTFNILKSVESFAAKFVLYVIQCDAKIQEAKRITSQEEFDAYIDSMTLKGFGGTDFRPVFDFVEKQREMGELAHLKGLIYFTDGYGIFPNRKPDYETAFVFLRDEDVKVPPWAIKLLLDEKEFE